MFLQVSVCPQGAGICLLVGGKQVYNPQADAPWADTPLGKHPQANTPLGNPPPNEMTTAADVKHLLECILVLNFFIKVILLGWRYV